MSGRNLPARARGVSLIELMIALAIGTLLILGLVQVFAASRTAYQLSEGMARTQENSRFATDYLQRDIRMAGHFGCVNDQSHLQTANALQSRFPAATPATSGIDFPGSAGGYSVRGYEANGTAPGNTVTIGTPTAGWSPALPGSLAALNISAGSDVLELRFMASEGVPVQAIINPSAGTTLITVVDPLTRWSTFTENGVAAPTMFGIADCSYADVFRATLVNAAAGQVTVAADVNRYTAQPSGQTVLYRAESLVYYVSPGASGQPALWRARSDATGAYPALNREELVEGVESLQFLYGLDRVVNLSTTPPSGYIDIQQPASGIANNPLQWRRVGSVRIGMLMSSPIPAAASQAAAVATRKRVLGVTFAPAAANDTRFRSSYEVTVALRNRLYGN